MPNRRLIRFNQSHDPIRAPLNTVRNRRKSRPNRPQLREFTRTVEATQFAMVYDDAPEIP